MTSVHLFESRGTSDPQQVGDESRWTASTPLPHFSAAPGRKAGIVQTRASSRLEARMHPYRHLTVSDDSFIGYPITSAALSANWVQSPSLSVGARRHTV